MLATLVNVRIFRKSPLTAYLRLNERIWRRLGPSFAALYPARLYGSFLHALVRLQSGRRQYYGTFFIRNRPGLELMRRLASQRSRGASLKVAVVASSNGWDGYSILWALRSAGIKVTRAPPVIISAALFDRPTPDEMRAIFDTDGDCARIKPCLKEGIVWHVADASDPGIVREFGLHDMVVANNFLCHMPPAEAERCLRNVSRLVTPGGYLFVSGVDLDVRTKVAHDLGWEPVTDSLEEIHDGDPVLRADWPFKWSGLEPLDRRRPRWKLRYASVFRIGQNRPV